MSLATRVFACGRRGRQHGSAKTVAAHGTRRERGIPSHVSGAGDYLVIVEESAARQVTRVAGQFAADAHVAFARLEAVDGADVVQATAGHVRAWSGRRLEPQTRRPVGALTAWSVGTGHYPTRSQRNGVNLVGRVRVPHN